eukprot:TRINITY_DN21196_c0_g1_i1.p1 TRINITY_DN21196_c0_g1~~TRINITY_DN21196_c0_g1_i1.p1  ORF type:complete len:195 (-),score=58.92 TRINITY_DN21196_c0_g1_i1:6-590(-)
MEQDGHDDGQLSRCDCDDSAGFASRLALYLENGSWEAKLTDFATAHSEAFKSCINEMLESRPGGEHHHGLYAAYRDFVALTDDVLDGFRQKEGLSQAAFLSLYREAQDTGENTDFLEALLSATEYQRFVQFMLEFIDEEAADGNEPLSFEPPLRSHKEKALVQQVAHADDDDCVTAAIAAEEHTVDVHSGLEIL